MNAVQNIDGTIAKLAVEILVHQKREFERSIFACPVQGLLSVKACRKGRHDRELPLCRATCLLALEVEEGEVDLLSPEEVLAGERPQLKPWPVDELAQRGDTIRAKVAESRESLERKRRSLKVVRHLPAQVNRPEHRAIVECLAKMMQATRKEIAERIVRSPSTLLPLFDMLREAGVIQRVGRRGGGYIWALGLETNVPRTEIERILEYVIANPGCRVGDIATRLVISNNGISGALNRLQKRGQVEYVPGSADHGGPPPIAAGGYSRRWSASGANNQARGQGDG